MTKNTITSISSHINVKANRDKVWTKVGFYEHVKRKASLLLRLSLPYPQQVEGQYSRVGDVCRCKYSDGGYLTKRITKILDNNCIEFEIIEQSIRYHQNVILLGGYIKITANGNNTTLVEMKTYYKNRY